MLNLVMKVTAAAFAASAIAKAAGLTNLAANTEAGAWSGIVAVAILSFGAAMIAGLTIGWNFHKPEKSKRDVEAYIDQMLAANGTHLNRERVKA